MNLTSKKIIMLCLASVLLFQIAFATNIEELNKLVDKSEGTQKADVLNELADLWMQRDLGISQDYADQANDLSLSLGYEKGSLQARLHGVYIMIIRQEYADGMVELGELFDKAFKLDDKELLGDIQLAIGRIWFSIDGFQQAQDAFEEGLAFFESIDSQRGIGQSYNNLGVVFESVGEFDKATDYFFKAQAILQAIEQPSELADVYNNLAGIYADTDQFDKAITSYTEALDIYESMGDVRSIAVIHNNLGLYFGELGFTEESKQFFDLALERFESLEDATGQADVLLNIGALMDQRKESEDAVDFYTRALMIYTELSSTQGQIVTLNNLGTVRHKMGKLTKAIELHTKALELAGEHEDYDGMVSSTYNLSLDHKAAGDYESAFNYMSAYKIVRDQQEYLKKLQYNVNSMVANETDKKTQEAKEARERSDRFFKVMVAIAAVSAVILLLLILVAKERRKSEKLLLNILPKKIAQKLKKYGKAESERYKEVTVYFSDIVGFTDKSVSMEPDFLISELNEIFTMFDNIMESYGCERIKTIGDAYLAVCGMPTAFDDHAIRMTGAAMRIRQALDQRNGMSQVNWQIRIGIHTGSVVGGIVGVKKYIYDVFGDTINTASRMESNSEPMKINITTEVYELIKDRFTVERRELKEIKGKGLMQMYFVVDEKNL
ncbi:MULTISPECIES: adenylate/guanylate cyclase domain-containing protein [unclassified Fusibacter]|uniref:adenylate/guanylate cyclase domain-containing protein n=1 Tax=unclassified Fusibacter TaxID=2624464 RepID=UPI0010123E31|nr:MULTISPECIES: adenylate/guanylate cyclase domain-containing protein [unclassified Fusibacter]MCK8058000.1 tetratricopeptide repeat protein [Fusibacter sp. A2]NPE20582.1 tetratricopeptide repeat protein [Fusibacter sp. A1]RXV62789.1 hypothetical protein DWB64_02025 [Fusibacter sp. A1]